MMGAERERSGAESGCHKSRLERWAANRPLTLRSRALPLDIHSWLWQILTNF